VPALLPADFCGDVHERLSIYKRLANCETQGRIDDMQEELIDRFGKLPDAVKALIETHRLRIAAKTGRHRQDRRPQTMRPACSSWKSRRSIRSRSSP
jgi:transcription-repair coupling factor (superfamily II helicase)